MPLRGGITFSARRGEARRGEGEVSASDSPPAVHGRLVRHVPSLPGDHFRAERPGPASGSGRGARARYDCRVHVFRALSDPVRLRIVEILASGEHLSGEISAALTTQYGVSRAAVSKHLAILRDNGWVAVYPEGAERWYSLTDEFWGALRLEVGWLEYLWERRIGTRSGVDTDPRLASTADPFSRGDDDG
jgi:DNA-binding transcriptional ArsR family regulator